MSGNSGWGGALDADAPAAEGFTVRQLAEQIAFLRGCGEGIPLNSVGLALLGVLSPISFVRLCIRGGNAGRLYVPAALPYCTARYPFLSADEASALVNAQRQRWVSVPALKKLGAAVRLRMDRLAEIQVGGGALAAPSGLAAGRPAFDPGNPVVPGVTVGDLVEQVTLLRERGEVLAINDVALLMRVLSPTSFVRVAMDGPCRLQVGWSRQAMRERFPFLTEDEAAAMLLEAGGKYLMVPAVEGVVRAISARIACDRLVDMSAQEAGGPPGSAFDASAFVAPGLRARDIIEMLAHIKARGGALFEGEGSCRIVDILSPASFVRLLMSGSSQFLMPATAGFVGHRFPWMSAEEVRGLEREFGGEVLVLPGLARLITTARHRFARVLREEGLSTAEIAQRLGVTTRWVRMLAPRPKAARGRKAVRSHG